MSKISRVQQEDVYQPNDCPVCGDGNDSLLSNLEIEKLILAAAVGRGDVEDEVILQIVNASFGVRFRDRALNLTLEGQLLPYLDTEVGDIGFNPIEKHLTSEEIAGYQRELKMLIEDLSASDSEELLTAAERACLTRASLTGCGVKSQPHEQLEAVLRWAEDTRKLNNDLQAILAGRLLPFIPTDQVDVISLKKVTQLPKDQQKHYQQALRDIEKLFMN